MQLHKTMKISYLKVNENIIYYLTNVITTTNQITAITTEEVDIKNVPIIVLHIKMFGEMQLNLIY